MPRNLNEVKNEEKAKRGTRQTFTEDNISSATTVFEDTYRDLLRKQSTESAKFYLGHGMRSRDDPNLGYMYAELHATGNGSGAAGDDVDGTFRFIVYADSEREVPIVGPSQDSRDMRDAVSANRTERPALPLNLPGAGKDKEIAVQFQAASGSDSVEVDGAQTNDDVLIPYTQILE